MCSCHRRTSRAQIGLPLPQAPLDCIKPLRTPESVYVVPSSEAISGAAVTMENVAIFDSPGKGRGLKATKEFWAGDVIFSEPSLAAVVFDR